jgi:hypothetical protein
MKLTILEFLKLTQPDALCAFTATARLPDGHATGLSNSHYSFPAAVGQEQE